MVNHLSELKFFRLQFNFGEELKAFLGKTFISFFNVFAAWVSYKLSPIEKSLLQTILEIFLLIPSNIVSKWSYLLHPFSLSRLYNLFPLPATSFPDDWCERYALITQNAPTHISHCREDLLSSLQMFICERFCLRLCLWH